MSFVKLSNGNIENVSILLRPHVDFVSSSVGGGVTGSQYVSPVRSPSIKQVIDLKTASHNLQTGDVSGSVHRLNEDNYARAAALNTAHVSSSAGESDIHSPLDAYLGLVDNAPKDVRYEKKIDVFRFDPPFKFTKNSTVKNVTRNVLMPYHQNKYDNCGFWYTNYNTLNFFTNSHIPTGSALLYPDPSERYKLPDSFAVSFWINPRYSTPYESFNAGTILHMSSSIAISLVSGSSVDEFGAPDTFKILLQLSQSVDKPPSTISLTTPAGAYPNDLIFTSSHTLKKNHWHNVFITWSNNANNSSGSLYIDDNETFFHIPSSSVTAHTDMIPDALILGNYYNGPVGTSTTGFAPLMTQTPLDKDGSSRNEGYVGLNTHTDRINSIKAHEFSHPLNAEIHDFRIYNKYINKKLFKYEDLTTVSPSTTDDMIFYLPVYFLATMATPWLRTIFSFFPFFNIVSSPPEHSTCGLVD